MRSRTHALATMVAGPFLWLLVLHAFIPKFRPLRWITPVFLLMAALPLTIGLVGWATPATPLFVFEPELYSGGYVPVSQALNGRYSHIFYPVYITFMNSLLVAPIGIFAFSRFLPDRLRRSARVLLLLSISVGLLYAPWFNIPPALRSMLTPVFAASGAAWVMASYRLFSPIELAMKQVVDTVTIGLLVFDESLVLIDANAFSTALLPIALPKDKQVLTLPMLLQRMLPFAENQTALMQLQESVQQKPEEAYQQELALQDGRSATPALKWILFSSRPVYDDNQLYLGLSCSIEDLTVERRTQAYITEAHKAIEQYAYNQALLNDITQAAISGVDFEATLSVLASRLVGLFDADHCYISIWDDTTGMPKPAVAYGEGTEPYLSVKKQPGEPSLSTEVHRRGSALPIEDLRQFPYASQRVVDMLPTRGMLGLPLSANGQKVGALLIGFNETRLFTDEEVKWGEQIARQLTLAIFKNRLLESEREQRILLEALQAAGQALTSTLDFEQVLDRILEEIARVVPYDTVNFALVIQDEAHIVRRRDIGDSRAKLGPDLNLHHAKISEMKTLQTMYETKRPLRITNTAHSAQWINIVGAVKSWMGVPLVVGDKPIAFLMVDKLEADFYQINHEEWLVAFASQAALALQHAQLFTEIRRRVTELEALSRVSAAFRSSETIPVILQAVLAAMVDILPASVAVAFLLNDAQTAVVSQACYPTNFYPDGIAYELGEGITGHVAQTGIPYVAKHLALDSQNVCKQEEPEIIRQLQASIALPLTSKEGILGVIHLGLPTTYEFADDEIRTLKAMSNIIANGLHRLQVMQTLEARVASRTYDLETANERLHELDKLKTKFIADVSHELRTPVANLSIYINLLENGKPEKKAQYLSILQKQANRLTNLVEATLGLAQLDAGVQNHAFGPIDLNEVVVDILQGHQARAESFGLYLEHELALALPNIWGNKIQLVQLVTNLVANAINYNQKGGRILVETFAKNGTMVCLKVSDDGIGISEAELPHLFDRFYRGHQTGQSNIPGTGLGLAIVKEIVDLFQGYIEVTSDLNQGTTFLVHLPIHQTNDFDVDPAVALK